MSKIVVAIDPFTKVDGNAKRAVQSVRAIADQLQAKLQSIAVVSPDQLKLPLDFEVNIADEFLSAGEQNLKTKQNQLKVKFDSRPEVAVQPYRSTKRSIEAVLNMAAQADADFLAVLTHVKKKPLTALFGFVESLVSLSTKPILAVNAKADLVKRIDTILFASDFSDQCKQAYIETLALANLLGAKVVVAHKSLDVESYSAATRGMLSPLIQAYEPILKAEDDKIKIYTEEWESLAELQNVEVEFVISRRSVATADVVLQVAKAKKAQLIVVVSQSGKYESLILGSVTRRLLQISKVPLLIVRENALSRRAKHAKGKDRTKTRNDGSDRQNESHIF